MPVRVLSRVELYHGQMRKLMKHFCPDQEFEEGHVWSREQLMLVNPQEIVNYIKIRVYGREDANPDVDPPVHYRSSTVKQWKKSWSSFMLNRNMTWNEIARVGNPTRSTDINDLIRSMKRMEVQRRGVPSQARRALFSSEFEQIVDLAAGINKEIGTWIVAYLMFQYTMIGRVDDTAKWRSPDLQPFHSFLNFGVCGLCEAVLEQERHGRAGCTYPDHFWFHGLALLRTLCPRGVA